MFARDPSLKVGIGWEKCDEAEPEKGRVLAAGRSDKMLELSGTGWFNRDPGSSASCRVDGWVGLYGRGKYYASPGALVEDYWVRFPESCASVCLLDAKETIGRVRYIHYVTWFEAF